MFLDLSFDDSSVDESNCDIQTDGNEQASIDYLSNCSMRAPNFEVEEFILKTLQRAPKK